MSEITYTPDPRFVIATSYKALLRLPPLAPGERRLQSRPDLNPDDDPIFRNIRVALATGLPMLRRAVEQVHDRPICVVGTGPSLQTTLKELQKLIQGGAAVCAIKGAHDWLMERGIVPDLAVSAEWREGRSVPFKRLNPYTTYLMASQCAPSTWERMRGFHTLIWHCLHSLKQYKWLKALGHRCIGGTSTTGCRTIPLLMVLGWRDQHLVGFDSCVNGKTYKITGERLEDKVITAKVFRKEFRTTEALAQQAVELREQLMMCNPQRTGLKVKAYGDGLFQEVLRQGKKRGWSV